MFGSVSKSSSMLKAEKCHLNLITKKLLISMMRTISTTWGKKTQDHPWVDTTESTEKTEKKPRMKLLILFQNDDSFYFLIFFFNLKKFKSKTPGKKLENYHYEFYHCHVFDSIWSTFVSDRFSCDVDLYQFCLHACFAFSRVWKQRGPTHDRIRQYFPFCFCG